MRPIRAATTRDEEARAPAFLQTRPRSNRYFPDSNAPYSYSLDLSALALGTNDLYYDQVLGPPRVHRHGGAGIERSRRPTETRSDQTSELNNTYDPRALPRRSYRGDGARGNGFHDVRL